MVEMIRIMLKSKIYDLRITDVTPMCSESIGIDRELMKKANIIEFEQVDVLDISNGKRFTTYAIPEESGACVYGAAAKLVDVGDLIIILSYTLAEDGISRKVKIARGQNHENCNLNEGGQEWKS